MVDAPSAPRVTVCVSAGLAGGIVGAEGDDGLLPPLPLAPELVGITSECRTRFQREGAELPHERLEGRAASAPRRPCAASGAAHPAGEPLAHPNADRGGPERATRRRTIQACATAGAEPRAPKPHDQRPLSGRRRQAREVARE